MKQRVFLVVGLGNPDDKYANTYHNVGFQAVEEFAVTIGATFDKGECRALTAHKKTQTGKTVVAKPITYMNLSGESVRELVNKYKIEQTDCIVIYDDADLPVGKIRIRKDGSGGSHNGMLNIIKNMGTQNVYRIRIGIDRPKVEGFALMDYVLSKISPENAEKLNCAYKETARILQEFCDGVEMDKIMMKYNRR